jgi:hypothetical protein
MTREEVRKLLGGYATGTLTEAEQAVLFAMALEDQELFDELGREQALRDLMRDPAAKAEMLAALDAAGERRAWWQMRPLMAGLAMAGVAVLGVVVWQQTQTRPRLLAQMDRIETSAPGSGVAPVPQAASPPVGETRAREMDRRQTPAARGNEASDLRPREEPLEKQAAAKEKDATLPSAPAPVPAAAPPPPPARQALGAVKDEVLSGNRVASSGLVAGTGGGGGGGARDAPKIMAEASQPQAKPAAATMAAAKIAPRSKNFLAMTLPPLFMDVPFGVQVATVLPVKGRRQPSDGRSPWATWLQEAAHSPRFAGDAMENPANEEVDTVLSRNHS